MHGAGWMDVLYSCTLPLGQVLLPKTVRLQGGGVTYIMVNLTLH